MIFSSAVFIYYFLPILFLCYFLVPKKLKNFVLLLFSLLFYTLGEPEYILVLLLSCLINYFFGLLIEKKGKKRYLIIAILYNTLQLIFFKYTNFFIDNINLLFNINAQKIPIKMPIGISFFTFQALGYVIDVYRKRYKAERNLLNFMTYLSMFPQLIAGPIVRYSDISKELKERKVTFDTFAMGIRRFIFGLAKKVLLANTLGELLKYLVSSSVLTSILKPIIFTFQIYFDFSGYSDMAIGLGRMFGFTFLENFNYPLIASSITDFWRRWHISLSSWFRDYIYIPLGGNRVKKIRWIFNIMVVWFLTGFWHGASWNFILWGLYFGAILITEKLFLAKYLEKTKVLKYIYTLIIIFFSFLIFSSNSLGDITSELKIIFGLSKAPLINKEIIYYLRSYLVIIIISVIGSTPIIKKIIIKIKETKFKKIIDIMEPITYIMLLVLITAFLIDESFNPFLYFRF